MKLVREGPAIWGGLECTINRVGDRYFDQSLKNGHASRIDDLKLFASLGIEKIRYPALWEKIAPDSPTHRDWTSVEARIHEMKQLGLKPIIGLLHHGSGPSYTNLLDPKFPEKFAAFARSFAEKFPEIDDYTPINEPLTTARFSALYGVWFPHSRDDRAFARAFYHQIRATQLAMREIRKVNPAAKLIQTEDLGRATGTSKLAYQVDFENQRRWLTFDLLAGRVTGAHPLHYFLIKNGITFQELSVFTEDPTPPNIIGINHYLLSNRFLDHRKELYPKEFHGGNEKHSYADVGAVDAEAAEVIAPKEIYREAWERYHIPVAVTEVHIAGSRETQLRWFDEIWRSAHELVRDGADIQAVTAWSLLGSYDWDSLCTQERHFYESGVFDVRSGLPRPTALAKMIRSYADGAEYRHPVLEVPGWWKKPERVRFPTRAKIDLFTPPETVQQVRPVLITGASGTLGSAFSRICAIRGIPFEIATRSSLDITDKKAVGVFLKAMKPWAVVNTAGYVRVDDAESDSQRCFKENVLGPANLAMACADSGIQLLCFSSDLVFGGLQSTPYVENDPVNPESVYGESKAELERKTLEIFRSALVIRTSSFFGPWDTYNFVTQALKILSENASLRADADLRMSPTYIPDLVNAALDLLLDECTGIVHLSSSGTYSWYELAKVAALKSGLNLEKLIAVPSREMGYRARRPEYSALASSRYLGMSTVENALDRYVIESGGGKT